MDPALGIPSSPAALASVSGISPQALEELLVAVVARIGKGHRVRRFLPNEGRLNIDQPSTYLCVYRRPDRPDAGTAELITGEGSYLLASGEEAWQADLQKLTSELVRALAGKFNAVLLMEVWARQAASARPAFEVRVPDNRACRVSTAALVRGLRSIPKNAFPSRIEITLGGRPAPDGLPPLLTTTEAEHLGVSMVGLAVPALYQTSQGRSVYPSVFRPLQRGVSRAIEMASFRFAHVQTSHRPEHFLHLGRRTVLKATLQADRQLAEVADEFNLLLAVTPTNAAEAYEDFSRSGQIASPVFRYRLLDIDPDLLKRRLYNISLERVEDLALGELLRDKRDELDRQITLLNDRESDRFLFGSLQLYPEIEPELLDLAIATLRQTAAAEADCADKPATADGSQDYVDAAFFAARAREELDRYRRQWPGFSAGVEERDDLPGLMVVRDRLLVDRDLRTNRVRCEALIHHEVGTHLVTYCNAATQPLQVLRCGLPGYDAWQEGTAVLSEYLVGGLSPDRLRLLAARVVAVDHLVKRRSFADVFHDLRRSWGFSARSAFNIAMRTFRGGGFTKDAVYLRGLSRLLLYLSRGGELEPLFLGKVSENSLPILQELRQRQVLRAAPLRPHYLDLPGSAERLGRLRGGVSVLSLLERN